MNERNFKSFYEYDREFHNVEVVSEEDLPRSCGEIAWILDEDDFEYYTIYEDCVSHLLYAVKENEETE